MNSSALFHGDLVNTSRIIYTPSDSAKMSLLHLQEIGSLQATNLHISKRENLSSYLFFIVRSGSGTLVNDGVTYELHAGHSVFIDCKKPYLHETSENLWNLSGCILTVPQPPIIMKNIWSVVVFWRLVPLLSIFTRTSTTI